MKDGLSRPAITRLAANLHRHYASLDQKAFINRACRGLAKLELKERVAHVTEVMRGHLPDDYRRALAILVAARKGWDSGDKDDALRGFAAWPLFHYIESYGLDEFELSMAALRDLTPLFSAEFAVRPFLARYGKVAFAQLEAWTEHEDEHVRRLASEGCRPRLPWASRVPGLIEDPAPILPILQRLRNDPVIYVRRSVANNLNDIAKDHPEEVIGLCRRWQRSATPERRWIIDRATRSLVKTGHPAVWGLLGYTENPRVKVTDVRLRPKRVKMGGELRFEFKLVSQAASEQKLVVDYAVHFMKANGATKPKVFKLKNLELAGRDTVNLSHKVSFKPISTRAYHAGTHAVEVHVNGVGYGQHEFELLA